MILFKESTQLKKHLASQRGKTIIGFVPTMGALHKGHISLIDHCKKKCDLTICSIFVNPTQFNDQKDFDKYPVTIEKDIMMLEEAGCDILFLPSVNEMYPEGTSAETTFQFGDIESKLEGKYREGHFQGVGQIVNKLLDVVLPDVLFIGQKDYQQCMIIKRLIELKGLDIKIRIIPTYREASGLAMSSRNLRLTNEQKQQAAAIYKTLLYIKEHYGSSTIKELKSFAVEYLLNHGFEKIDYVSIANSETLAELSDEENKTQAVALIAAYIGGIRLIDNMQIN